MQKTRAVVDSDFLQGMLHNGTEDLFKQLMDELSIEPVVHPYVAEVELQYCKEAQKLIDEGFIKRIEYEDFLYSDVDRAVYNAQVWEILDEFSEKELPPKQYRDVFRDGFRLTEYSIGEILSELMAKSMKLPLFASNDFGAKNIARIHINSSLYSLNVKNIADLLYEVVEQGSAIPWNQIKTLLREARWKKDRETLREKWLTGEKKIS